MQKISEMSYHIGLRVKIYPSNKQKHLIAVNDGAKRAVYNFLVASGNERYRLGKTADHVPVYRERIQYLKDVVSSISKLQNALPFLYSTEVDAQTIANTVKNYRTAWKNQKEQHRGVPTFKKKSSEQSYQTNAHYYALVNGSLGCSVSFEGKYHVILPKIGRIRMDGSPKLIKKLLDRKDDIRIGTVTISKDAVGEYWVSFSLGSNQPFYGPLPKTGLKQGIDLNLIDLVNDSDGGSYENRRFYIHAQKELAKKQRRLNRMGEHAKAEGRSYTSSKHYQKQRKKVAFIHRKIQRQRTDYLHNLSKQEIENQDFLAAEDLKVANLKKNHHLAKAISDASWRTFLTMLQYKGTLYGKTVVLIPPQYTTQTCHKCGYVMKGKEHLTLACREWNCPNCHTHHDRDTNAAKNILAIGLRLSEFRYRSC